MSTMYVAIFDKDYEDESVAVYETHAETADEFVAEIRPSMLSHTLDVYRIAADGHRHYEVKETRAWTPSTT